MRKWMYETVMSVPGRNAAIGDRLFTTGTVEGTEPGDSPTRPFAVIRFATKDRIVRLPGTRIKQQRVQVWVHDDDTTMLDIDKFVLDIENHCPAQAPQKRPDEVIMDCEWEDTSGDGYDDHYQTNTRYVTFLVTYKELS